MEAENIVIGYYQGKIEVAIHLDTLIKKTGGFKVNITKTDENSFDGKHLPGEIDIQEIIFSSSGQNILSERIRKITRKKKKKEIKKRRNCKERSVKGARSYR